MKKIITLMLVAVLAVCALSGCGTSKSGEDTKDKKIKIVTTIFPEYDWVMQILGDKADKADVTMLLDKGVDLHSYQPSTADIAKISEADVFIYVGGESDEWVEDVLKEAKNKKLKVINLMDVMGDKAKEEEVKEGMQQRKKSMLRKLRTARKRKKSSTMSTFGYPSRMQRFSLRRLLMFYPRLIRTMLRPTRLTTKAMLRS